MSNEKLGNKNHQSTPKAKLSKAQSRRVKVNEMNIIRITVRKTKSGNNECDYKQEQRTRQTEKRVWKATRTRKEKSSVYFHLKDFIISINRSRAVYACRCVIFSLRRQRRRRCFLLSFSRLFRFIFSFGFCSVVVTSFCFWFVFIPYHELHFPRLSEITQTLFELMDKCE